MTDDQAWRGRMGGMSPEEVEEFLAGPHMMSLACLKPNGDPYLTIVWHEWRDGAFWVVARQRSPWAAYLRDDPRCSFAVERWDPLQKVWGEGRAEVVEEPNVGGRWVPVCERMSIRYVGPDGPTYLVSTLEQPRWLLRIVPTVVKTWQGVGWARRYWVQDAAGPTYDEAHGL
jgi:hypothetical protein